MKCRVPMWMGGFPSGHCDKEAFGDQLPRAILERERGYSREYNPIPYCFGPCCPAHGGPQADEIRVYADGYTPKGRPMWCAVMPDFINLQESEAGFDGNPFVARDNLRTALAEAREAGHGNV